MDVFHFRDVQHGIDLRPEATPGRSLVGGARRKPGRIGADNVEKYLELTTQITLRNISLLVWNITESHIRDSLTGDIFKFTSPSTE